jgi:hypothetical protein
MKWEGTHSKIDPVLDQMLRNYPKVEMNAATKAGLDAIGAYLGALTPDRIDFLRGTLRVGIHRDVEVTSAAGLERHRASQAFFSALPVAYSRVPPAHWRQSRWYSLVYG